MVARGQVGPASNAVVPFELRPEERRQIPLDRDHLRLLEPRTGEQEEIRVTLHETLYGARLLVVQDGEPREWTGSIFCYELESEAPYTWAVWWLHTPLAGFRLFATLSGENYLAWVQASAV